MTLTPQELTTRAARQARLLRLVVGALTVVTTISGVLGFLVLKGGQSNAARMVFVPAAFILLVALLQMSPFGKRLRPNPDPSAGPRKVSGPQGVFLLCLLVVGMVAAWFISRLVFPSR